MAIDTEGKLWVASFGGSQVLINIVSKHINNLHKSEEGTLIFAQLHYPLFTSTQTSSY
jgi:hypothetical protein